jgi:hypothetical protein
MQRTYSADAYFQRLDSLFLDAGFDVVLYKLPYWRHHRFARSAQLLSGYLKFLLISLRLLRHVKDPALKSRYGQQLLRALRVLWCNPHMLFVYAMKTALHYHYASITRTLAHVDDDVGVLPDAVRYFYRSLDYGLEIVV